MSTYVDGFVLPIPTENIATYRAMAEKAAAVWREHGALAYCESVLEDPEVKFGVPFAKLADVRPGETVVFAFITFASRSHRDEVNARVMADPRLQEMCGTEGAPFDFTRMAYGGFETLVEA